LEEKEESFVKKFFPTCKSSPGGNQKLINKKPTDVNSARGRDVGKVMARTFDLFSVSTNFSNFNNSPTVTQNLDNKEKSV
jgi:hypothetical protein